MEVYSNERNFTPQLARSCSFNFFQNGYVTRFAASFKSYDDRANRQVCCSFTFFSNDSSVV